MSSALRKRPAKLVSPGSILIIKESALAAQMLVLSVPQQQPVPIVAKGTQMLEEFAQLLVLPSVLVAA